MLREVPATRIEDASDLIPASDNRVPGDNEVEHAIRERKEIVVRHLDNDSPQVGQVATRDRHVRPPALGRGDR